MKNGERNRDSLRFHVRLSNADEHQPADDQERGSPTTLADEFTSPLRAQGRVFTAPLETKRVIFCRLLIPPIRVN